MFSWFKNTTKAARHSVVELKALRWNNEGLLLLVLLAVPYQSRSQTFAHDTTLSLNPSGGLERTNQEINSFQREIEESQARALREVRANQLRAIQVTPQATEAEIRKLITTTGKIEGLKQMSRALMAQLKKTNPRVPQALWEQLQSETNLNELIEAAIPIYQKYFTEDEVKGLIAFNESPLGQKMISVSPQLTKELMEAGVKWGEALQKQVETRLEQTNVVSKASLVNGKANKRPRPLTEDEANRVRSRGLAPTTMTIDASLPEVRELTSEELQGLENQGIDSSSYKGKKFSLANDDEVAAMEKLMANAQVPKATTSQNSLNHAYIWLDNFMGITNAAFVADVITIKTDFLKFSLEGQTYDYSGHYTIMLATPRQHSNPYLGLGTPPVARLVILENFGKETMPLQNATIWEKSNGFIDVTAMDKEWIYSGVYTIQK